MNELEITDLVSVAGDPLVYRRLQNEASNVELARRSAEGWTHVDAQHVSGDVPPDAVVWEPMLIGDALWQALVDDVVMWAPILIGPI